MIPGTVLAMRSDGPLSLVTRCTTQPSKFWCMRRRRGELVPSATMQNRPRRMADLYVYLAQYHGPQDANVLGRMACGGWPWS